MCKASAGSVGGIAPDAIKFSASDYAKGVMASN
jgi:hypothetical protein